MRTRISAAIVVKPIKATGITVQAAGRENKARIARASTARIRGMFSSRPAGIPARALRARAEAARRRGSMQLGAL